MDKIFIIVDQSLSTGLKMAQACHALRLFQEEHTDIDRHWYDTSNNIVVLEHDDPTGVAKDLDDLGIKLVRFHEPDLNDLLTAICVEPKAWRYLSNIRLAS